MKPRHERRDQPLQVPSEEDLTQAQVSPQSELANGSQQEESGVTSGALLVMVHGQSSMVPAIVFMSPCQSLILGYVARCFLSTRQTASGLGTHLIRHQHTTLWCSQARDPGAEFSLEQPWGGVMCA